MKRSRGAVVFLAWAIVLWVANVECAAAEPSSPDETTYSRQVTFTLTFDHRELVWHGDPASPAALVYIPSDVQPIATDVQVATRRQSISPFARRYLREARITDRQPREVYAFTRTREHVIGTIDGAGRFVANDFYRNERELLPSWPSDPSVLAYDERENALYYEEHLPGPHVSESFDFLPLVLCDTVGDPLAGRFAIDFRNPASSDEAATSVVSLRLQRGGESIELAQATLPRVLSRAEVELGSFDNRSGTYLAEAAYRAGAEADQQAVPGVTFEIAGDFHPAVNTAGEFLALKDVQPGVVANEPLPAIAIDGRFDDWRNVPGVDDVRGDVVPYLEYVPDTDLLEFKVAHDDGHLYLYARVAGQVGRTHPDGGRSYFYAYIDVDRDAGTGFLPTRDDECYYGVDVGDDCEVQFEFVDNTFRKTFYGFCGLGGDDDVLRQVVTLGKSRYGRFDENGQEREHYKSEYIYRDGVAEITKDLKLGTSDTIHLAVSPDGREVEIASSFSGFLKNRDGQPILGIGQAIDVAAGMECDSKAYPGKTRWAADSTPAIRGYELHAGVPRNE